MSAKPFSFGLVLWHVGLESTYCCQSGPSVNQVIVKQFWAERCMSKVWGITSLHDNFATQFLQRTPFVVVVLPASSCKTFDATVSHRCFHFPSCCHQSHRKRASSTASQSSVVGGLTNHSHQSDSTVLYCCVYAKPSNLESHHIWQCVILLCCVQVCQAKQLQFQQIIHQNPVGL